MEKFVKAAQRAKCMRALHLTPLAPALGAHLVRAAEGGSRLRAIRIGEWKLVSKHPGDWELYHITTDRTEMNDLAAQQPDRVKEMAAQWDTWAKRVGVMPWPLAGEGKKGKGKKKPQ
jgi:arylsulfatase A-like enzyme